MHHPKTPPASPQAILLPEPQQPQAAAVLAKAFLDDPVYEYIHPEIGTREAVMRKIYAWVLRCAQAYGEIYTTESIAGAACWLPPGKPRISLWQSLMYRAPAGAILTQWGAASLSRALKAASVMEKLHHHHMPGPHWYLWSLGVEPSHQGQGIGGTLMRPILALADREGIDCYLETAKLKNVPFYQKHGFEVIHEQKIPQGEVPIWLMARYRR